MPKRKLHPKELRLVISARRVKANGTLRDKTRVHAARQTVKGNIIFACGSNDNVDLLGYYYFPFIRFIYDNAPMCPDCVNALETENILTPASNTGVNSRVRGN